MPMPNPNDERRITVRRIQRNDLEAISQMLRRQHMTGLADVVAEIVIAWDIAPEPPRKDES